MVTFADSITIILFFTLISLTLYLISTRETFIYEPADYTELSTPSLTTGTVLNITNRPNYISNTWVTRRNQIGFVKRREDQQIEQPVIPQPIPIAEKEETNELSKCNRDSFFDEIGCPIDDDDTNNLFLVR